MRGGCCKLQAIADGGLQGKRHAATLANLLNLLIAGQDYRILH
jgi:hypothetical protein